MVEDVAAVRGPALVLGVGLGGLVDGIVLHQVLQWHHLVSSRRETGTVAGLEANVLADGLFHAATWLATAAAIWWLWRRTSHRRLVADRELLGWTLAGWGAFHVLDELTFHAFDVHHIREGTNAVAYDIAFTAIGLALVAGGLALARR